MRFMLVLLFGLGAVVVPLSAVVAQDVSLGGQVRPRVEFRDPVGTGNDGFTSMRVRLDIDATLARRVRAFIQVQDVRLWGEETNTLSDFRADNFDLHQGYVEVYSADRDGAAIRLGRQTLSLGGQRLIGAVEWTQQGRSFDGGRGTLRGGWGSLDVFGFKLAEATAPGIDLDAELVGAYAQLDNIAGGALDVYALYNHRTGDPLGDPSTNQLTMGARLAGARGPIQYRVEGTYQTGDRADVDIAAFMVGARIGMAVVPQATITLWYDYLSGDDDPADDKIRVFETLFATNHKYYGLADLFLDIPAHTGGLGLQDLAVKGGVRPRDDVRIDLDLHAFLLARDGGFGSRRLGEEIDLTAAYRFSPNLTVSGGVSQVLAGDALEALGRLSENMTWAYLMVDASF